MTKYWVKNRLIFDLIVSVLLSLLFSFAFIFSNNNICKNIENDNRIYIKSKIDYQIPNPSSKQLEKIKNKDFVDNVFGYYLTKINVSSNKSVKVDLLLSDTMENLSFTMYNDSNLINTVEHNLNENYAYLDYKAAKLLNVNCGDEISFAISNETFKYKVCSIYQTNTLFKNGTVLVDFSDSLKNAYEVNASSKNYSGAFIDAKDTGQCETYLKDYIPEGRLKDRSEFDTEEEYLAYNNAIKSGDYSNEISNFSYSREQAINEFNEANKNLLIMSYVGSIIVGVIYIFASLVLRRRKTEEKYFSKVLINKNKIYIYRLNSLIISLILFVVTTTIIQLIFNSLNVSIVPIIISSFIFIISFLIDIKQDKKYIKG